MQFVFAKSTDYVAKLFLGEVIVFDIRLFLDRQNLFLWHPYIPDGSSRSM